MPHFNPEAFPDFELTYEASSQTVWAIIRPDGPVRATVSCVRQLSAIQRLVADWAVSDPALPIRFCVSMSKIPGIYNFGGDLPFFIESVRQQDDEALRQYAHGCVEVVYGNSTGWGASALSVALVQGDALGGGFESAISHNIVVAERSAKMGMPEILFNSFPGMGAFTFLTRRLDAGRAERMILSGKVYSAAEMFDMGLVDVLAEDGCGKDEVRRLIGDVRRYDVLKSIRRVRERMNPISLAELLDITDIWVENVMRIHSSDLRRMERLVSAQTRRLGQTHEQHAAQ